MAFYEHRLPIEMSKMISGGLGFRTLVNESDSGFEKRLRKFSRIRGRWDVRSRLMRIREDNPALRSDIETLQSLHAVQEGKAHGFRFRHEGDFKIGDPDNPTTTNQFLANGDDALTQIQIFKRYTYGAVNYDRLISKIVSGTYTVLIDGTPLTEGGGAGQFQFNVNTAVITLGTALASGTVLQIATEYDVPVRFDVDLLDIDYDLARLGEIPSIPLVELKIPAAL